MEEELALAALATTTPTMMATAINKLETPIRITTTTTVNTTTMGTMPMANPLLLLVMPVRPRKDTMMNREFLPNQETNL